MDRSGKEDKQRPRKTGLSRLTQSALIAALYLALTLATSFMSFAIGQLRLAEALTALAALFPSAVMGLFLGCLLANLLNPQSLGLIDLLAGSAVTLLAAFLTWRLAGPWRRSLARQVRGEEAPAGGRLLRLLPALLPPVVLNALVVGSYLPFLVQTGKPTVALIALSIGSLFLSQALVVFGLGLPLVLALKRTPWAMREYLVQGGKSP